MDVFLLCETGDFLLLETGYKIIIERQVAAAGAMMTDQPRGLAEQPGSLYVGSTRRSLTGTTRARGLTK